MCSDCNYTLHEPSDTGYSEEDAKEICFDVRRKKTAESFIANLDCTKVFEIYITKNFNVIACCNFCLYETEIKNINCLLEHFQTSPSHSFKDCQNNSNDSGIIDETFFEDSTDEFENRNLCLTIHPGDESQKSYISRESPIKTINKQKDNCSLNSVEILNNSMHKYDMNIDDFENNFTSSNNIESENEISDVEDFICGNTDSQDKCNQYLAQIDCDFALQVEEPDLRENNTTTLNAIEFEKSKAITEQNDNITNLEAENLQSVSISSAQPENPCERNEEISLYDHTEKLDEQFYSQLGGLNTDQSLCQFCNTKFRFLSRHYKNRHPEIILCEVAKCYQSFKSLPDLNAHHAKIHSDPDFAFTCTICPYKTNTFHYFRFHYQRKHLNVKYFKCDFCDMNFFTNYEKTKHMRMHTGQKPYECDKCGTKYPTKQQLNLHIQKYHSEPQFQCDICDQKFYRKQTLKEHQMTKHALKKEIICEICGDSFYLKKCWRDHYNNAHNPNKKRWSCNECGKSFSRNSSLREHKVIHCLE